MFLVIFYDIHIENLQNRSAYATMDITISNLLKSETC
jgi:hypothetical protein